MEEEEVVFSDADTGVRAQQEAAGSAVAGVNPEVAADYAAMMVDLRAEVASQMSAEARIRSAALKAAATAVPDSSDDEAVLMPLGSLPEVELAEEEGDSLRPVPGTADMHDDDPDL